MGEDPTVQAHAVRYYVMKHDVPKDEALRRIELQDAVMPSMGTLESTLGDRYGGAWFDANDGGLLKVAVVDRDSDSSSAALAGVKDLLQSKGVLADTELVDVATSYNDLVAASHTVAKALGAEAATSAIGVDVKTNAVVVTSNGLSGEGQERLQRTGLAADVAIREKIIDVEFKPEKRCSSASPFCDRPLRGGVEISMGGSGACTAGFNVTSRSDGKRYVMTAGHCKFNSTWSTKTNLYGQWNNIGPEHNMQFWYTGRDIGIIRDQVPSYWQQSPFPGPTIWLDDIPGNFPENTSYYIGQEANAVTGTVVCMTGGGGRGDYPNDSDRRMFWHGTQWQSYTWCGTVTVPSETVTYDGDPSQTVYNLVRTDVCFWGGMSGGPVFKWNIAYGIISGDFCPTHQWSWYYPAILGENDLNVDIVH